jgi:hypothetical protein
LHAEYIFMQGSLATRSLKFDFNDASPWMKEESILAMLVLSRETTSQSQWKWLKICVAALWRLVFSCTNNLASQGVASHILGTWGRMNGQTNVQVWRMTWWTGERRVIIAVLQIFCFEVAIIFEMFSKIFASFLWWNQSMIRIST